MLLHKHTSLVDLLQWRAINQPERLAYIFLVDGEYEESSLTYKALNEQACSIATLLQSSANAGDRALLLFPPGLDFIAAYFGCLYAGIVAVPVYPPHPAALEKTMPALRSIIADAAPAVALLTASLFNAVESTGAMGTTFENLKLLVPRNGELNNLSEKWQKPVIAESDIAFLQYTSGSTTTPRGVIVRHNNLLHNLEHIEKSFGQSGKSHAVIWLPPYHDMGLIGGILQPVYSGYPVTLIPHLTFLQRPYRWLKAISRFKATTSGGPNFAYDLCVRKIKPEQCDQLDLSNWSVAFNGAEPVYHKTLDQFASYFAPCGFRREAFLPCYGLAESTLLVTGGPKFRLPRKQSVLAAGLENNQVIFSDKVNADTRILVSCGKNLSDHQEIRIVNRETAMPCAADEIGEIWLQSPSVSTGYWNKPLENEVTFGARLATKDEGTFLRTGDLGFLSDGELFITGRIKDVIISEGKNHYPQDIEKTVETAHPNIWPSGGAAFSVASSGTEQIVVIAEVKYTDGVKEEEVIAAIRQAIAQNHGLSVGDIRLTIPGGLPRTTSGKIRHFLCKKNYMEGTFKQTIGI